MVLAEDWDRAAKVMRRIGRDGTVDSTAYRNWPLFRNLRKQEIFLATYQDVFGEAFIPKSEVTGKELIPTPVEAEEDGVSGLELDGRAA